MYRRVDNTPALSVRIHELRPTYYSVLKQALYKQHSQRVVRLLQIGIMVLTKETTRIQFIFETRYPMNWRNLI